MIFSMKFNLPLISTTSPRRKKKRRRMKSRSSKKDTMVAELGVELNTEVSVSIAALQNDQICYNNNENYY